MMTVDYALRLYTDMANAGDKIDIKYFNNNLDAAGFKEFMELIPFINLIESVKVSEQFHEMFKRIDAHKVAMYDMPSVVNFRAERSSDSEEACKKLDEIFDKEFDDE